MASDLQRYNDAVQPLQLLVEAFHHSATFAEGCTEMAREIADFVRFQKATDKRVKRLLSVPNRLFEMASIVEPRSDQAIHESEGLYMSSICQQLEGSLGIDDHKYWVARPCGTRKSAPWYALLCGLNPGMQPESESQKRKNQKGNPRAYLQVTTYFDETKRPEFFVMDKDMEAKLKDDEEFNGKGELLFRDRPFFSNVPVIEGFGCFARQMYGMVQAERAESGGKGHACK